MVKSVLDVDTFIRNIESALDNGAIGPLKITTRFREAEAWTSLQALIVAVSIEGDYGVSLSAEEFERAQTLQDLYEAVQQRIGS
jgi:acyl carrier protein